MRFAIILIFAFIIANVAGSPTPSIWRKWNDAPDEKRDERSADDATAGFAGRAELRHGHPPAKDYIVIEILKPIVQ